MYHCYLHLKNEKAWLQHLQKIKVKYSTITEEALNEIFSFPFEIEWLQVKP